MRIDESVLDAPAGEGARLVALGLLSEADEAVRRLANGGDDEALHDFRVALRRVRTALRAFRPWLEGDVRNRHRRKLRKIARSTNASRDAEVQLAWLSAQRGALASERQRAGLDLVVRVLEGRARRAPEPARVAERYARASRRLKRRLAPGRRREEPPDGAVGPSFAKALAELAADQLASLRERTSSIHRPSDVEPCHEARIAAKRLRYLLEPLRGSPRGDATEPVRRLKRLQDLLGELHDMHLLAAELRDTLDAFGERTRRRLDAASADGESSAAIRGELQANPRPGLLAVGRLVRARRDALWSELERERRSLGALTDAVRGVAGALGGRRVLTRAPRGRRGDATRAR